MELSEKIKQIKEEVMLEIHAKNVPISLEDLATHNKNIDTAIKEIDKVKVLIKELKETNN